MRQPQKHITRSSKLCDNQLLRTCFFQFSLLLRPKLFSLGQHVRRRSTIISTNVYSCGGGIIFCCCYCCCCPSYFICVCCCVDCVHLGLEISELFGTADSKAIHASIDAAGDEVYMHGFDRKYLFILFYFNVSSCVPLVRQ